MKQEIIYAILIGVLSGVITAIMIWVIREIFIKIITPWFEQIVYKGVLLDGAWSTVINSKNVIGDKKRRVLKLDIIQKGNRITGAFYALSEYFDKNGNCVEDKKYENHYYINGSIKNNYLVLNYEATSKNRTGLGTLALQITTGGNKMSGGILFVAEGSIETISVIDNLSFVRV